MVQVTELSDRAFRESVIDSDTTTIVLFYDPRDTRWLSMKVIIDELANEFLDTSFARVNVWQNADTPARYSLLTFPTILVIENGKVASMTVGATQRQALYGTLRRWLKEA